MESTNIDTLQALQMADLGTARREYISTTDDSKHQRQARIEDIEASRLSNVCGTVAANLAAQNKDQLNAWSNLHKTVSDTGKLEDLNDLMHGQSHRLRLTATLHGGDGIHHPSGKRGGGRGHHPYPHQSLGIWGSVKVATQQSNVSPKGKEDFSRKITAPEIFLANARASFGPSPTSSESPSSPPPRACSTAVTLQTRRPGVTFRPEIKIPISSPADMKPIKSTSTSLADSIYADATKSSARIVPIEKTAVFTKRTKLAHLKSEGKSSIKLHSTTPVPITSELAASMPEKNKAEPEALVTLPEPSAPVTPMKPQSSDVLLLIDVSDEDFKQNEEISFSPGIAELAGISFEATNPHPSPTCLETTQTLLPRMEARSGNFDKYRSPTRIVSDSESSEKSGAMDPGLLSPKKPGENQSVSIEVFKSLSVSESSLEEPPLSKKKSRVVSEGLEKSKWSIPQEQEPPSRQPNVTSSKVRLIGPAPPVPRRH
ncbi:hypothetical protein N7462_009350 [Penicillium macrosclerotiorum]|uniref:uncharacterized protein n=1 Tax=Penicillium macrosclerotiorum TaxID=303699 RepID=UPI0025491820|nr:uncharacterized protein N7462_009350 [Penicillium macrosclerotiorum]KAJ5673911.1 hypothetical protein N7462_009350 [Penicillium macrosclerotiorum]